MRPSVTRPLLSVVSRKRPLHAPLPAARTSNREHATRHKLSLVSVAGGGRERCKYQTAHYPQKLVHGRRLGNKPSRLITGSMNFNARISIGRIL